MPQPSSNVFHAYDIRGLSPGEIDEAFASRLSQALISIYHPRRVMVGRDMREMSPALEAALVEQFVSQGIDVTRIGLCTTPMFNVVYGLSDGTFDCGVMVTASHNPGIYNGFKLFHANGQPIGQGSGMEVLAKAFEAIETDVQPSATRGTVQDDSSAVSRYVDRIMGIANIPADMPHVKVAIDAGNGMAGVVLPELMKRLPWLEVIPMYFDPDGTFPHHEANPLKKETLVDVMKTVVHEQCALGVAFDGDADRVGFVDETGTAVPGDLVTALLAEESLKSNPGGLVFYDLRSSWAVPEAIRVAGGEPRMCRVGRSFIMRRMAEEGGVFAGEVSMHYYFKELRNVESNDLAMLWMLRKMAQAKQPLSGLWKPLARYAHSGELNFPATDPAVALERVRQAYAGQASAVSDIDGVRMEFRSEEHPEDDWWFSVRASNTEPLVRLNVESRTPGLTAQHVKELSDLIRP